MKYWMLCAVALVAVYVMVGAVGAGAEDPGGEVRKACSTCHSIKRVCKNLGVKNEAAWKLTLMNMKAKGARLAADRINPVAEYLTGLPKSDPAICD